MKNTTEEQRFIKWVIIFCALIVLSFILAILVTARLPVKENTAAPISITVKTAPRSVITDIPYADKSYTVTATVMPADAENKRLNWTATFENPNSGWAKGKSVTEYIKLTPSTDTGACTIECLKAFGENIVVTATSEMCPNIKATCRCGFLQSSGVIGGCWISFGECSLDFDISKPVNTWTPNALGNIYDPNNPTGNYISASEISFSCELTSTDNSTVQDSYEYNYTFEATEAFKSKMQSKGFGYSKVIGKLENGSIVTDIPENFAFGCYFPLMGMDGLSDNLADISFIMNIDSAVNEVMGTLGNAPFMSLTITASGRNGTYTQTTSFIRG